MTACADDGFPPTQTNELGWGTPFRAPCRSVRFVIPTATRGTRVGLLRMICQECGAVLGADGDDCQRRSTPSLPSITPAQPWGSRHGRAFSAFALQHPNRFPLDVPERAWILLYSVYIQISAPSSVTFIPIFLTAGASPQSLHGAHPSRPAGRLAGDFRVFHRVPHANSDFFTPF